jgi:CO/xanthine dehydrogenase FAD-binding subunit
MPPTESLLGREALVCDRATTLPQALELRARHKGSRVLAGGTDIMVDLEFGIRMPNRLLDIWGVDEIRGVRKHGSRLWIGALTTFTELITSPVAVAEVPSLVEAARTVGALQIQNRGTLGGNLGNASPAGDTLPVLLTLEAVIEVASRDRGSRFIPVHQFFVAYRRIRLDDDELITGVWLPGRDADDHTHYRKVGTRSAQAISKVVFAGRLRIVDQVVQEARIAFGSMAAIPIRCTHVEEALVGRPVDPKVALLLPKDLEPIDDIRSTGIYRLKVGQNLIRAWLESLL